MTNFTSLSVVITNLLTHLVIAKVAAACFSIIAVRLDKTNNARQVASFQMSKFATKLFSLLNGPVLNAH